MNSQQLYCAIGEVKDAYIEEARLPNSSAPKGKKPSPWVKWGSMVACFALLFLLVGLFASRSPLWNQDLPGTMTTEVTEETAFGTRYVYGIDNGPYASYIGGKVIDSENIGEKLEDVTVTAGWITDPSQNPADESLRGEIYEITGISPDVAVALLFLDKGDALTTTHYYVILNPEADLSPVADYVIPDYVPDPREE